MDIIEYKAKQCNSCSTIYYPAVSFFWNKVGGKDNLASCCKKCSTINGKQYYSKNKKKIKTYLRSYQTTNKNKIKEQRRIYRETNKAKIKELNKNYYIKNKKEINKYNKLYKIKNRDTYNQKTREYLNEEVLYIKLKDIDTYESVREHPTRPDIGQIKCTYCGKWTIPTFQEYISRKKGIFQGFGGGLIYCSTECKIACPTYGQHKYPKGFKTATSREVNPLIRQMCFEYDNYTCQKCYKTDNIQLHCHHIIGATKEPLLANDIDNVITLCKDCHKQVHKQTRCSHNDYRRKQCA